ncbi:hypothetical protein DFH08DRAFT_1007927 [Mycena albidolilacea]|uniref:Uncharacterized protein n=1 Tax=Mycena albidolilacea TaxID=1033008 RepID=A0AAD6ZYQ2_9AGAR|nr:hypothetical protein DFH08DRAFT_1007927 [Mycena albidolilacea]
MTEDSWGGGVSYRKGTRVPRCTKRELEERRWIGASRRERGRVAGQKRSEAGDWEEESRESCGGGRETEGNGNGGRWEEHMTPVPDVLAIRVELYWDGRRKRAGVRPSLSRSECIGVQKAASGRGGSREKEQGTGDEREPMLRERLDRRMRREGGGRGGMWKGGQGSCAPTAIRGEIIRAGRAPTGHRACQCRAVPTRVAGHGQCAIARWFGKERRDEEGGRGRQERVKAEMGYEKGRVRCAEMGQSEEGLGMGRDKHQCTGVREMSVPDTKQHDRRLRRESNQLKAAILRRA